MPSAVYGTPPVNRGQSCSANARVGVKIASVGGRRPASPEQLCAIHILIEAQYT
jgi:hypothetical protein